jgi:class 3 adenylate cyclase
MIYLKKIKPGSSEDKLEKLVKERLTAGADKKEIDRRIWDLFGGEYCVMFTDLSGFSRNVAQFGIIHFLQTIYQSECVLAPVIDENDGLVLKFDGDSLLIVFRDVPQAITAAVAMQRKLKTFNMDKSEEEKVLLCVGLGYGPMLRIGDSDIFGAEVNAASKLGEDVAGSGQILVTESVRKKAGDIPGISFEKVAQAPAWMGKAFDLKYNS